MKTNALLLIVCCLLLQSNFQLYSQRNPETTRQYLTGTWKLIKTCGGVLGGCHADSRTDDFLPVEGTTDSLTWIMHFTDSSVNSVKVKLCYLKSELMDDSCWMLIGSFPMYRIIYVNSALLALSQETYDGMGFYFERLVSHSEFLVNNQNVNYKIYTNTASKEVIIENAFDISEVKLFDINAREVLNLEINHQPFINIDIETLKRGIYILQICSNKRQITKKIVKN